MGLSLLNDDRGRKLLITQKDGEGKPKSIVSKTLYIDGDFDLKTNSNFSSLWKSSSNSLMNLISSSFTVGGKALPSGQFAMQGVQIWESTDPLNFSINAHLYMIDNAYEDVVKPAIILANLVVPSNTDTGISDVTVGKYTLQLKTLIPPGPNIEAILRANGNKTTNINLGNLKSTKTKGIFDVKIADYMTISNVIVKSADVSFSNIMDENGFPTSCDISFEFTTMEVATSDMLLNILNSMDVEKSTNLENL